MPEFKFAIGQYVTLRAQVDMWGLANCQPCSVSDRMAVECEGGEQRHYDCRVFSPPSYSEPSTFTEKYYRFKESELTPLDIEAYNAARVELKTRGWSPEKQRIVDSQEAARIAPKN